MESSSDYEADGEDISAPAISRKTLMSNFKTENDPLTPEVTDVVQEESGTDLYRTDEVEVTIAEADAKEIGSILEQIKDFASSSTIVKVVSSSCDEDLGESKMGPDPDSQSLTDHNMNIKSTSPDESSLIQYEPETTKSDDDPQPKIERDSKQFLPDESSNACPGKYDILFYPFRQDPTGKPKLIFCSSTLEFGQTELDGKLCFFSDLKLANFSNDVLTYRIVPSHDSRYVLQPEVGLIDSGVVATVEIYTDSSEVLNYSDIMQDSFKIQATSCKFADKYLLKESEVVQLSSLYAFWDKFTTFEFPIAEEVVIREIVPRDLEREEVSKLIRESAKRVPVIDWLVGVDADKKKLLEFDEAVLNDQEFIWDPSDLHASDLIRNYIQAKTEMLQAANKARLCVALLVIAMICIGIPVTHYSCVSISTYFRVPPIGPRGWWDVGYYLWCVGKFLKDAADGLIELIGDCCQWVLDCFRSGFQWVLDCFRSR